MNPVRRTFLQAVLASLGRVWAQGRPNRPLAPGCRIFTVDQARTLAGICEQIIPADDYPGAKEAGVLYYIDGSLAGELRRFRKDYNQGLALVDKVSRAKHGSAYTDLNWEQQLALLQQLEKDPGKGGEFFALVRQHTMEGYYGDPKYGGNRNSVSWKMIGFKG
ncbi:MAG: gluconate 2-dehydrogenase subunit 3 family protein [Acidobacteria bacterium]|nr:gluconate 2-dehydrogenase subunit 3 family protein [Acidobacteriota bacterium]